MPWRSSVDKATAENYIETYDGMKIVAASMTPVLGAAAANKISALGQRVVMKAYLKTLTLQVQLQMLKLEAILTTINSRMPMVGGIGPRIWDLKVILSKPQFR